MAPTTCVTMGLDLAVTSEAGDRLRKTADGIQIAVQCLLEVRSSHGFASQGKDPEFRQLDAVQVLPVERASDAFVSFLFQLRRTADGGSERSPPCSLTSQPSSTTRMKPTSLSGSSTWSAGRAKSCSRPILARTNPTSRTSSGKTQRARS